MMLQDRDLRFNVLFFLQNLHFVRYPQQQPIVNGPENDFLQRPSGRERREEI